MPHLATTAALTSRLSDLCSEIARKPKRAEMWTMMGVMTGAFAAVMTSLTFLQHWIK